MKEQPFQRSIPGFFYRINNEDDPSKLLYYQNILACIFGALLMFLGGISNLLVRCFLPDPNIPAALFDGSFFMLLAFAFIYISKKQIPVNRLDHLVSILYCTWIYFIVFRYYSIIGPAIWTLVFFVICLSMIRLKLTMLAYLGFTIFTCGLYVTFILPPDVFQFSIVYFLVQNFLFTLVFIIAYASFSYNIKRYNQALDRLHNMTAQKKEIGDLYEEILVSKEELDEQHKQLKLFNEEIRLSEEKLHFLAHYDHLTELPNRKMMLERLHLLVKLCGNEKSSFYIVFIDLDNFKKINDTLGHTYGDHYLKSTANRLQTLIHAEDLLGRIGGDEFALIIQRNIKKGTAYGYIENLRNNLCEKIIANTSEFNISASFGISVFPQDGVDPIELLKNADTSMYKAKELGKNNIQFFRKDMKDEILEKIEMESLLLKAYENKEFFIEYQPQFTTHDHTIRGFEALIRWNSPRYGRVPPLNFIPLAEEMGLIIGIGEWVLFTACHAFKELEDRFNQDLCLSVNISSMQMKDNTFVNSVKQVLLETQINPEHLELEITESLFIDNIEATIEILNELKALNIRIALDDFGTGFSSLSYLRRLPIDTLKIDKSFIDDLSTEGSSSRIVGDIISLGHNLDAAIVAEGIENSVQFEYLKDHKCDCIQGFMFGKPMSVMAVEELLNQK